VPDDSAVLSSLLFLTALNCHTEQVAKVDDSCRGTMTVPGSPPHATAK
jgi:hypothetical protein